MTPKRRATLAYITAFCGIGAVFPYLAVHYRALGIDLATIGALSALWAASSLVAAPTWGTVTDRLPGSRLVLPAASFGAALAATGLALATEVPTVAVGVVLLAAAASGVSPMLDARTLDLLGDDRGEYGRIRAWGSVSFIVAATAVGFVIEWLGSDALFLVYVPSMIVTGIVSLWLPRSRRSAATGRFLAGAGRVVRSPGLAFFLVGTFLVWTAVIAVNGFVSVQLVALGAPPPLVGLAWSIGSVIEVPIMFAFPRLAARFGLHRLIVVGAVAFALRAAAYAALGRPELIVAATALEGAGFGLFYVGSVAFVGERAPAGLVATGQGVLSAVAFGLASIVGNVAGGLIATAITIPGLFAVGAVASTVAAVVVAAAVSRAPRHVPAHRPPSGG